MRSPHLGILGLFRKILSTPISWERQLVKVNVGDLANYFNNQQALPGHVSSPLVDRDIGCTPNPVKSSENSAQANQERRGLFCRARRPTRKDLSITDNYGRPE